MNLTACLVCKLADGRLVGCWGGPPTRRKPAPALPPAGRVASPPTGFGLSASLQTGQAQLSGLHPAEGRRLQ